jgi:hypothetical protein
MSDTAPAASEPARRLRDWNGLSAVIAALIGLLALCVSGYTAWLQRQQVRAQVWPYIESGLSQSGRYVLLANKGVGPARIETVQMFVDGRPHPDWNSIFATLGLHYDPPPPYSTVHGIVISAGGIVQQLAFRDEAQFRQFDPLYARLDVAVCYCSSLGECWQLDEREADGTKQRRSVEACPRSAEDFLQ